MSTTSIIDNDRPKVVFREQPFEMSDEKFKSILSQTYERGHRESKVFSYREWSSAFFSSCGTLFLTNLTASFQSIWFIDAKIVTIIAWALCGVFLVLGIVFRLFSGVVAKSCPTDERNKAVQEILDANVQQQYIDEKRYKTKGEGTTPD